MREGESGKEKKDGCKVGRGGERERVAEAGEQMKGNIERVGEREKGEKEEKGRGKETEINTCWFLSDGHCRQIVDDVVKLSTFCHVLLQHRHAVLNQHLGQIREDM